MNHNILRVPDQNNVCFDSTVLPATLIKTDMYRNRHNQMRKRKVQGGKEWAGSRVLSDENIRDRVTAMRVLQNLPMLYFGWSSLFVSRNKMRFSIDGFWQSASCTLLSLSLCAEYPIAPPVSETECMWPPARY
jgi:hypothetical protein